MKWILLFLVIFCPQESPAQAYKGPTADGTTTTGYPHSRIRYIRQGSVARFLMNNAGGFGAATNAVFEQPYFAYPVGEPFEHLFAAGLWVGAMKNGIHRVTKCVGVDIPETVPVDTMIWESSIDSVNGRNRRFVDDDGDGKIDEDDLDGVDNDHDGLVDEDYGAVSEHDVYVTYTDTTRFGVSSHVPLGLKIIQRSYSWEKNVTAPIFPIEYTIVNVGTQALQNVFIALAADFDVLPLNVTDAGTHNYAAFMPTEHTGYVHNAMDRGCTPIGVTLLQADPFGQEIFHMGGNGTFIPGPDDDGASYQLMTCFWSPFWSCIDNPIPPENPRNVSILYSMGTFRPLEPGDTIHVSFAFVLGDVVDGSPTSLYTNAHEAHILASRNFTPVPIPPSPPLKIRRVGSQTILDWKWQPGDPGNDPLASWDAHSPYLNGLPDSNWRKQSPTGTPMPGGRNFGGFKVWRCALLPGSDTTWSLAAQFAMDDVPRSLVAANDQFYLPLQYSLVESTLHPGSWYGYAVTSFSFPDMWTYNIPDSSGQSTLMDTLAGEIRETQIKDNATFVNAYFPPSKVSGEVKVVPNPYRGDIYYTDGNGFEGPERSWTPAQRSIWFVHLPARATIRIYSLAGEVIRTISHDDASRASGGLPVGQEEWQLVSESGRPIASGLYLFSVDSDLGQQVGKFVIIL